MPIVIFNEDMIQLRTYYGYKFEVNYYDKYVELENKDRFYFTQAQVVRNERDEKYLEVVIK